jgi:small ligand-binding sensory domain FIST
MAREIMIATAIAAADKADPELAGDVVRAALARAGSNFARSVLLFLSADFVHHAHAAVAAAARAGRCLQVTGCTAPGILTEEDWILDRPAAAAMVFDHGIGLSALADPACPALSLATPNATAPDWLAGARQRYGLLSTSATAHGSGRVWCHGKLDVVGHCDTTLTGARVAIGVSHGVKALSEPLPVTTIAGYELLTLGSRGALNTLLRKMPADLRELEKPPLHLIAAGVIDGAPAGAIEEGRFRLVPVLGINREDRSVALAARVEPGEKLFWALRHAAAAEADMRRAVDRLEATLAGAPDCGLLFSCLGRGPYFFGGEDRDLAIVKERFPGIPLIGAYGGGQIAPLTSGNRVVHNTAVLALFRADVQP